MRASTGFRSSHWLNAGILTMHYGKEMTIMHQICNRSGEPSTVIPMTSGRPGNSKNEPHLASMTYRTCNPVMGGLSIDNTSTLPAISAVNSEKLRPWLVPHFVAPVSE